MLKHTETKVTLKNAAFFIALGLAALGGVAVVWNGNALALDKEAFSSWVLDRIREWNSHEYTVPEFGCDSDLANGGIQLETSSGSEADTLWLCVDRCCDELRPQKEGCPVYVPTLRQYLNASCIDKLSPSELHSASVKLVASSEKPWMGHLLRIGDHSVWIRDRLVMQTLSTDRSVAEAKRGVSYKWKAANSGSSHLWFVDEDVPVPLDFDFEWNVKLETKDVQGADSDNSLCLCVDDCCEKLNNAGFDNYERGQTDYFRSNCAAPTDASTLKVVATGGDVWMGSLQAVYGDTMNNVAFNKLVLSTQSSDYVEWEYFLETTRIKAKRGVTLKKHSDDGKWQVDEDIPFDYFPWNVEITTTDVTYAGMDGSLKFCVDDCCEKLNNSGEDNYERGLTDHFLSKCKGPKDAATIKLLATSGDGWIGALQNVYGADVMEYELKLSTQSSDFDGTAKRGAVFRKGAGQWHFDSDVPY